MTRTSFSSNQFTYIESMIKTFLLAVSSLIICSACVADAQTPEQREFPPQMPAVKSPKVPKSIEFAGTTYDFDRIDMYERIDRELAAICYTHNNTMLLLKRANRYFPQIIPLLKKAGVTEDLIYLACTESSMNPTARSSAKAAGIWQFMPATAKEYGLEVNDYVDERYDIEKATAAAARMLKKLYNKYGNWESAFAAYNGGPARIAKELDAQQAESAMYLYLTEETSRYMFRVLAMKQIMENPRAYGFNLDASQFYTPMKYDIVKVSGAVEDWPAWALDHGITYLQLKDANPWIRAKSLPNKSGKTYNVRIPTKDSLSRSKAKQKIYNQAWIGK